MEWDFGMGEMARGAVDGQRGEFDCQVGFDRVD